MFGLCAKKGKRSLQNAGFSPKVSWLTQIKENKAGNQTDNNFDGCVVSVATIPF